MRVAISVQGSDMSATVDPRFGRAQGFLVVNSETGDFEYLENPNIGAAGGAGIQTSQMLVDRGVEAVITGNVGPNAYRVLDAAGIKIFTGASGTADQALADFKAGKLSSAGSATVEENFGIGRVGSSWPGMGSGRGMGRGGGRCRGGGGRW